VIYEYAPHGVAGIGETATDNTIRTVANVAHAFYKSKGYRHKWRCSIYFYSVAEFKVKNTGQNIDELELELIRFWPGRNGRTATILLFIQSLQQFIDNEQNH
jgi:transcriptional/translational regulatory protein YebC/TACO1